MSDDINPQPITGIVGSVVLSPGRPDVVEVLLTAGQSSQTCQFDATAEVTVRDEGGEPRKVAIGELFAWLAGCRTVGVVLHPLTERYGLSLKTDFYVPGA